MERILLRNFPVTLTFEDIKHRFATDDEEDLALLSELFETACRIAKPKALFRGIAVEDIQGDEATMEGHVFKSPVLANNLKGIHRVVAYVVTCGTEVDDWSHGESDYVVSLWLDMMKEYILGDARKQFIAHMKKAFGMEKIASMSPGSGNEDVWPIQQQRPLFDLLGNVTADTGVQLTDSFLMLPTKSVSGILYPSQHSFTTCALCSRENCVGRRAPHDPALQQQLHTL